MYQPDGRMSEEVTRHDVEPLKLCPRFVEAGEYR
jgi:hypothetical protein